MDAKLRVNAASRNLHKNRDRSRVECNAVPAHSSQDETSIPHSD